MFRLYAFGIALAACATVKAERPPATGLACPPGTEPSHVENRAAVIDRCVLSGPAGPLGPLWHGPFVELHRKPDEVRTGEYFEGRQHGSWRVTAPDGGLTSLSQFDRGVPRGEWQSFYENGNPMARSVYGEHGPQGVWTEWYEDGLKKSESTWQVPGHVRATLQWTPTGAKYFGCTVVDNVPDGVCTLWHADDVKAEETRYVKGQRQGRATTWYATGKMRSDGEYQDGKQQGPWKQWYETGALHTVTVYELGEERSWKELAPDGGEVEPDCRAAADCVLVPPPACCGGCTPDSVTRARAPARVAHCATVQCPPVPCMPSRPPPVPACARGKCAIR